MEEGRMTNGCSCTPANLPKRGAGRSGLARHVNQRAHLQERNQFDPDGVARELSKPLLAW